MGVQGRCRKVVGVDEVSRSLCSRVLPAPADGQCSAGGQNAEWTDLVTAGLAADYPVFFCLLDLGEVE